MSTNQIQTRTPQKRRCASTCLAAFLLVLLGFLAPPVTASAAEQVLSKPSAAPPDAKPQRARQTKPPGKSQDRAASVTGVMSYLGLGAGAAVADIGAGRGDDTWVFAELVGDTGTVSSVEIGEGSVKALRAEAEKRGLSQVRPVLGRTDDPCLAPGSLDVAFMRQVYHHFTQPREMLRAIWRSLKPGGHLVVVDKNLGTLRDWVPLDVRGGKHYWTAETTVVREAREEGFLFVDCIEEQSHIKDSFVLVFQRPKNAAETGHDPDAFLPLPLEQTAQTLVADSAPHLRPVFVALGEARGLMPRILKDSSAGLEIVLEEWATQKDERPALPNGLALPSVLTEKGDPRLGPEPIDAVYFLDSYHLLFHGPTLVAKLHERLAPGGRVYILDRVAKESLSRREASHRRQIEPAVVQQEMAAAGFVLQKELPRPAADRFLLVFTKTAR